MQEQQSIFGEDFLKPEEKQYNTLNLGPTHPATHGVFQNVLQMDGEIIVSAEPTWAGT